jgi:hypothetical protein
MADLELWFLTLSLDPAQAVPTPTVGMLLWVASILLISGYLIIRALPYLGKLALFKLLTK